ncbi:MAG: IS110 family transposase, partial [Terriglobales bacterium]
RQKTDRRDALLLARVVASGRFPDIWVPEPKRCDLRHLILHRHLVVRMRTQVRNNLHAVAGRRPARRPPAGATRQFG